MERVPEKNDVPGREEQLRWLLEKLTGHEAFGRLRGTFMRQPDDRGSDRMGHLHRLVAGADSPTAFCKTWDAYAADARVIGDILAQLTRDGWSDAADELEHALEWVGYSLPGETIRLDATVPVTVLIVDFPRTHAMLTWIRAGHWMDLDTYLQGKPVKPLAQQLFARFPSLQQHTVERHQRGDYEGWDILAAYRDDVLYPFIREAFGIPITADSWLAVPFLDAAQPMEIGYGTYNDHLEVGSLYGNRKSAFGFLFLADQADVLTQIPREHQHRVTTWGFRLPTVIVEHAQKERDGWMSAIAVGFHGEEHHSDWEHAGGAYPSHGCSNEYGAVVLDRRRYQYQDHLTRYNETYGGGYCSVKQDDETVAFLLQPR